MLVEVLKIGRVACAFAMLLLLLLIGLVSQMTTIIALTALTRRRCLLQILMICGEDICTFLSFGTLHLLKRHWGLALWVKAVKVKPHHVLLIINSRRRSHDLR